VPFDVDLVLWAASVFHFVSVSLLHYLACNDALARSACHPRQRGCCKQRFASAALGDDRHFVASACEPVLLRLAVGICGPRRRLIGTSSFILLPSWCRHSLRQLTLLWLAGLHRLSDVASVASFRRFLTVRAASTLRTSFVTLGRIPRAVRGGHPISSLYGLMWQPTADLVNISYCIVVRNSI